MPKQKPGRSKQNYATPKVFIAAVLRHFGLDEFAFDYAADKRNAKARRFWSKRDDALSKGALAWRLELNTGIGWLNPPFDHIGLWALRCASAAACGAKIIMLVPASVGSNWFVKYVFKKHPVVFLNGRISFDGIAGYPKDLMLVCFGFKRDDMPNRVLFDTWRWK